MFEKLTKWLIFGVFLALIPLVVAWLIQFTHTQHTNLEAVLSHGELLLITAGISAASTGELFGTGPSYKIPKILSGGASILILFLTVGYFADISATSLLSSNTVERSILCETSITLFVCTLVTSTSCIILSEV